MAVKVFLVTTPPHLTAVQRTGGFVVLEGGDGSGKSTQAAMLAEALKTLGARDVVHTFEPGGTMLGRSLRIELLQAGEVGPWTEALLYAADRARHVEEVIEPALARGAIVVSDRFLDSSIAYQAGGRGLPESEIRAINAVATRGIEPDMTVVLDISPRSGALRRDGQNDRIESESLDFHARVRQCYLDLAGRDPDRYAVIDAALSRDDVHRAVVGAVLPVLARLLGKAPG